MTLTTTDSPINGLTEGHLNPELLTKYILDSGSFTKETRDHAAGCSECQSKIKRMKEAYHSR